jgi:hypothetical protein
LGEEGEMVRVGVEGDWGISCESRGFFIPKVADKESNAGRAESGADICPH